MKKYIAILLLLLISTTLISCRKEEIKKETYNLILANATIPPLMAVLDTIESGNETYMWYGRNKTFKDISNLEEHITFIGDPQNQEETVGIKTEIVEIFKNIASKKYYGSNKTAKFNIYVVDYGIKAALQIVLDTGIPKSNYHIYLLEDGTGSYDQFFNIQDYDSENGIDTYKKNLSELNEIFSAYETSTYKWDKLGNLDYWNLALPLSSMENVSYFLQYPETFKSMNLELSSLIDNDINLKKKKLTSMFQNLSDENKSIFKSSLIDSKKFDEILNINDKPNLVVTGTSYFGEEQGFYDGFEGENEFEMAMDKIIATYADKYNILFKPHPAWMPSLGEDQGGRWKTQLGEVRSDWYEILESRVKYLDSKNIVVLPGQTPIEAILWSYPDVKIGGYNSSLYMNAGLDQVLFFILSDNDYNLLSAPLPTIIEAKGFINSQTNENPIIISGVENE